MALARGLLMFQDDTPGLPFGAVRGWKVGFGYTNKGTIVIVYTVGEASHVTEVPLLGNGKADVASVTAVLSSFGITLANAVKQVIGA